MPLGNDLKHTAARDWRSGRVGKPRGHFPRLFRVCVLAFFGSTQLSLSPLTYKAQLRPATRLCVWGSPPEEGWQNEGARSG